MAMDDAIIEDLMTTEMMRRAVSELSQRIYEGNVAAMSAPPSPVTLTRLRRMADTAAESLTRDLAATQLNSIGNAIARAVEQGRRPADAFRDLKEVTMLDSNRAKTYGNLKKYLDNAGMPPDLQKKILDREYNRLLNERKKTIAQTEGRKATSEARRAEAEERGNKYKAWSTSNDDRVSDICAGNEAAGIIPINEAFPSGHMQTPGHPNCRCTIVYLTESTKFSEQLQEKRIERTKEAREAAAQG